jgi:hypothetical protein
MDISHPAGAGGGEEVEPGPSFCAPPGPNGVEPRCTRPGLSWGAGSWFSCGFLVEAHILPSGKSTARVAALIRTGVVTRPLPKKPQSCRSARSC